jgi:hypothetical protein
MMCYVPAGSICWVSNYSIIHTTHDRPGFYIYVQVLLVFEMLCTMLYVQCCVHIINAVNFF